MRRNFSMSKKIVDTAEKIWYNVSEPNKGEYCYEEDPAHQKLRAHRCPWVLVCPFPP